MKPDCECEACQEARRQGETRGIAITQRERELIIFGIYLAISFPLVEVVVAEKTDINTSSLALAVLDQIENNSFPALMRLTQDIHATAVEDGQLLVKEVQKEEAQYAKEHGH